MKKKGHKKEALTALVVSVVLLIIVSVGIVLFDYYVEAVKFDTFGMIVGDAIGFLLLFLIVYRFEVSSSENRDEKDSW